MPFPVRLPLSLTLALAAALATRAQTPSPGDPSPIILEQVVVTAAPVSDTPLKVVVDTQAAAQPIPAQDGADILKTVPGFSVSRKGGTGGEIVLRGQSGSRIDLLLDGECIHGGCPFRMDPPTAYIFPGAFDRVIVLKGPQTVLYGPGNSAGVVLFESDSRRLDATGTTLDASLTLGSFGRNDQVAEAIAGSKDFYVRAGYDRTQSSDYKDGDGNTVHSQYERSSTHAAAGWTPDANTLLELTAAVGEGEAAYAGMSMDATQLDRDNVGLRFRKTEISELVSKVEAQISYNYADHIMDDFRLRTNPMPMGQSEVDYRLLNGRGLVEWALAENTRLSTGADFSEGRHRSPDTGSWVTDSETDEQGLFAELTQILSKRDRLIGGLRTDRWHAKDLRSQIFTGGMMGGYVPNPTANATRTETLPAGFVRYERDLESLPATAYIGVGYTERTPDYWELFPNESATTVSAFLTDPEKTAQIDAGLNYHKGPLTASLSAFVNRVNDYILYQSNVPKGMSTATITRNVDASSWGGEAGAGYAFNSNWKADASVAYVYGTNLTDHVPLGQQPPLEGRLGLTYATPVWSVGGLARFVAEQDRYAVDQGSIAGQDLGRTGGFAVFSLNAGWRVNKHATLTAGVDNLFDKAYAEHISRAGSAVTGYPTTTRVNEPGRTLWLKMAVAF